MTDFLIAARSAREQLAQALAALQAPEVPGELLAVAQPIAEAMRALHSIEASRGESLVQQAPVALQSARRSLSMLQTEPTAHAAVEQAIESVAASLGLVHDLNQAAKARASSAPEKSPERQSAQPVSEAARHREEPARYHEPERAVSRKPERAVSRKPEAPAQRPSAEDRGNLVRGALQPPPGALSVNAELGAHSSSNFYKGLGGGDVLESGGVFIATYQIPEVGQDLLIQVSLPGGYEFEAVGVVSWTRDAPHSGTSSPPGFGARFTQISPEGRKLVQRYVRNREPLFHD
ncbi:MAG TPA: PilZ domain-containing protein [Polyangiaceae bacterium]